MEHNSGVKTAGLGGVALFAVIFFASGIPRVQDDILKKFPIIGNHYHKDIPASDNVREAQSRRCATNGGIANCLPSPFKSTYGVEEFGDDDYCVSSGRVGRNCTNTYNTNRFHSVFICDSSCRASHVWKSRGLQGNSSNV